MLQNFIAEKSRYFIDCCGGNFVFLSSHPSSRYDGFFVKLEGDWFKTISFIENLKDIRFFEQGFYFDADGNVFLDCRQIFDLREWGRLYEIFTEEDCLIIKFSKVNDDKESFGKEFALFLAIKGDYSFSAEESWVKHKYSFDKERNSFPFSRFVFNLGKFDGKVCVSVDFDKDIAVENVKDICKNLEKLTLQKNYAISSFADNVSAPRQFQEAAIAASKSLLSMHYDNDLLIGIPWFVYPWARDELISAKALFLLGRKKFASKIVFKWLDKLNGLELKTPLGLMSDSWWSFMRAEDRFDSLNKSEKDKLKTALKTNLKKIKLSDGIVMNKHSTWMDSLERDGALEVNALVLAACRLADKLKINNFGKELKENVKKEFFRKDFLKDCFDDDLIRPNIFIAAYVYPELLSKREWCKVFDKALRRLWLPWGGLSTVDKKSPLFHKQHTGEISDSYHNGDSWFWINNLAAIVLHRFGKKKYANYIKKIAEASAKEILKMGAINHHAELSSANKLCSQGCLSQAWSNALFVELMFELKKIIK